MPAITVEGARFDGAEIGLRVGEDGLIAESGPASAAPRGTR